MAKRQYYPGQLDRYLATCPEDMRQEFMDFASVPGRTLLDLQKFWLEREINFSTGVINSWRSRHLADGRRTKALENILGECRNISPLRALEYAIATCLESLEVVRNRLDNEFNKSDCMAMVNLLRELRASSSELHNSKMIGDQLENFLGGAYNLAQKLDKSTKTHPNHEWLLMVVNAELQSVEDELNSSRVKAE